MFDVSAVSHLVTDFQAVFAPHSGVGSHVRADSRVRKSGRVFTPRVVAGLLCLVACAALATIPFALMAANGQGNDKLADHHNQLSQELPPGWVKREIASAHVYNTRLFEDGQRILGQATNPWSGKPGPAEAHDKNYLSQLDAPPDGIMSIVKYPRLGISLPVRHGTSKRVLDAGAGHLYGSSLPVGGRSTLTVISAHTGLADRVMFDRLSLHQGRVGDLFYLVTLDRPMAYKVESIRVIRPDDFTLLRIQPGRDMAVLLTCTPYGINTMRLLVIGHRVPLPRGRDPTDQPPDHSRLWMRLWVAALWTAVILVVTTYVVRALRGTRIGTGKASIVRKRTGKHARIARHAR